MTLKKLHIRKRFVLLLAAIILGQVPSIAYAHPEDETTHNWRVSTASWYGPGLYGNRMACGQRLTTSTQGVAHKTLPCGTLVRFKHQGREVVVRVVDRGPYVRGREWDLTEATCRALNHCFTGSIIWTR